jgi:hypothetical protein
MGRNHDFDHFWSKKSQNFTLWNIFMLVKKIGLSSFKRRSMKIELDLEFFICKNIPTSLSDEKKR